MPQIKPVFGTPLNIGHPLASGLVGCWPMNECNGKIIYNNCGSSYGSMLLSGNPLPQWGSNIYGSSVIYSSALQSTLISLNSIPSGFTFPISFMLLFTQTVANGNARLVTFSTTTAGVIDIYIAGTTLVTSNTPMSLYVPYALIITINSSGIATLYLNSFSCGFGSFSTSGVNGITLGNLGYISRSLQGNIDGFMLWNRVLSSIEVAYLNAFPFCMFDQTDLDHSNMEIYGLLNSTKGLV